MNNLVFFDKHGNKLNFNYNNSINRYEGDILFDINSNDTYKTQTLYTFEEMEAFSFYSEDLNLRKFQLFNEYGFHFYGSNNKNFKIYKIEACNKRKDYYSKWIYGNDIHNKFPVGTLIKFDNPVYEFTNVEIAYMVISYKKDAILIISGVDNKTFNSLYHDTTFIETSISSVDAIGIYDYIDVNDYVSKLSFWNEPDFTNRLYKGRKLSIVNSENNDNYKSTKLYDDVKIVTVDNPNLGDIVHYEYILENINNNLCIEVLSKTDLPLIYNGVMFFHSNTNPLIINGNSYGNVIKFINTPTFLKSGISFKVTNSNLNKHFLSVSKITHFNDISTPIEFKEGMQVIYDDKLYQCITPYTHSSDIQPDNNDYWGEPSYLPISELIHDETITSEIFLTTDTFRFIQEFNTSSNITLASAVEQYKDEFITLGIDLYYDNGVLKADLIHPTKYAEVNFYEYSGDKFNIDDSNKVGGEKIVYERLISVEEKLNTEYNYNYSERHNYNIVITDLDDYGLRVEINKMFYNIDSKMIYSNGTIDLERTIDKTLRAWLELYQAKFNSLGLNITLQSTNINTYYNTINISTSFPNIDLDFRVTVGSTADFYIENKTIVFYNPSHQGNSLAIGNRIEIIVNDRPYVINVNNNLPNTIVDWCNEYSNILDDYGIYVIPSGTSIKFNTKSIHQRCDITVNIDSRVYNGDYNYKIYDKIKGNFGTLLTSNEVLLNSTNIDNFNNFSVGTIFSINETGYTLQNTKYNVLSINENMLNISYEGAFWGLTNSYCDRSPFTMVSFTNGFTASLCDDDLPPIGNGGEFDLAQFSKDFYLEQNENEYLTITYEGFENMVDIAYANDSERFYVLGDGNVDYEDLLVIDYDGNILNKLKLIDNLGSIKIIYNTYNGFVYCLTLRKVFIIEPNSSSIVHIIDTISDNKDIDFNINNGNVYILNDDLIINNFIESINITTPINSGLKLKFNSHENSIYISTLIGEVISIKNDNIILTNSFNINNIIDIDMLYNPSNESIYVYATDYLYQIRNGNVIQTNIETKVNNYLLYNPVNENINISSDDSIIGLDSFDGNIVYDNVMFNIHGYQAYNLNDNCIYISNQDYSSPGVWVLDGDTGSIVYSSIVSVSDYTTKIIYNPKRKSVWALQPNSSNIIEVVAEISITYTKGIETYDIEDNDRYGVLASNYIPNGGVWLHVDEQLRTPRGGLSNEPKISLYWRWLSSNIPEFFMYDFSGRYLPSDGILAYKGDKPLKNTNLNRNANRDLNNVYKPEFQQTIFDNIYYDLLYLDDIDNSLLPEPLELFIGYNSKIEGAHRSVLQLYKTENIDITYTDNIKFSNIIEIDENENEIINYGILELDQYSLSNFLTDEDGNKIGFKKGQLIAIYVKDNINKYNQYISNNNGLLVEIDEVTYRTIRVKFLKSIDKFTQEETHVVNYPSFNVNTNLSVRLRVWDSEIGRFNVYGQTEVEDIRYKTELGNIGKLIAEDDVYIFKEYDIKEEGIDWNYLNSKRKEMLIVKNLIYNYIGSYKSIINAINYFGYNDLILNEYYRNVDFESKDFLKLHKVEIPDIFDNTVKGWKDNDFIKNIYPNDKYNSTNLFNLTYRITDSEGNKILNYTLQEVQTKLQGLKNWLEKNIIPITHKIYDITGHTDFVDSIMIQHKVKSVRNIKLENSFTPVSGEMNELYLMPINSGSSVYNCVIDLFIDSDTNLPDYYDIEIRTYETHREWFPFLTYNNGDIVKYYDKHYASITDGNYANNPKVYDNVKEWVNNYQYKIDDLVKYEGITYIYVGYNPDINNNPSVDYMNWIIVSDWVETDVLPVQDIVEYRNINNLNSFHFTVDTNIDPYIVMKITSCNSYGMIYTDYKMYEIKSILDNINENIYKQWI